MDLSTVNRFECIDKWLHLKMILRSVDGKKKRVERKKIMLD